jgi:hypothetical protein
MRDQNEEAKLPRLRCPYCSGVLQRVALPSQRTASHRSHARRDVELSPAHGTS